jgi:hypothetical protein
MGEPMTKRAQLPAIQAMALAAAKKDSRHVYLIHYVGGAKTISKHAPDEQTRTYTYVRSSSYALQAGVTVQTGLRHLRLLAAAGLLTEVSHGPGHRVFRVPVADADRIGCEHIAELQSEGFPFDDEWRRRNGQH